MIVFRYYLIITYLRKLIKKKICTEWSNFLSGYFRIQSKCFKCFSKNILVVIQSIFIYFFQVFPLSVINYLFVPLVCVWLPIKPLIYYDNDRLLFNKPEASVRGLQREGGLVFCFFFFPLPGLWSTTQYIRCTGDELRAKR